MLKTSRRAVLAGIAAAPTLAATALALSGPDPIFAAIDRYKRAVAARSAALTATWGFGATKPFPEDSPESAAATAAHDEAFEREWEAFEELFATKPETVAGIAALLDQLAADPYASDENYSEAVIQMAFGSDDQKAAAIGLLTTLASTLRAIGAVS